MFNLYNLDGKSKTINDNYIEKLVASLEYAMGAIVKKIEDVLAPPSKDELLPLRSVPLLQSEIYTVYKFISLSGFWNRPVGLYDNGERPP